MGETARAEIHVPSPCERCGAPCEVESDGDTPRLKCKTCSHAFDVALVQASIGKWTVVDPDGIVRRFSSWQELIGSLPNASSFGGGESPVRSTRGSSAAALLDVTPPPAAVAPGAPRLSLVPGDDPPPLPREARPRSEAPPKMEAIEDLPDEEVVPASDGFRIPPVRSIPPPLPPKASMPPPAPIASVALPIPSTAVARNAEPSEPPPPPLPPPPPAPKGGTLRTLPPPPRRDLPAPPPPTIKVVESNPPPPTAEKSSAPPAAEKSSAPPAARVSSAPPSARSSARSSAPSSTPAPAREPSKVSRRDAEPAASRWFLPFVAIGILALGIAYVRRSSPSAESDTPGTSSTNVANDPRAPSGGAGSAAVPSPQGAAGSPSATTPMPAADNGASAQGSSPATSAASGVIEPKPPATGGVGPERVPVGDSQLPLPDVLERAAAARRAGDPVHAKALLERALVLSPGNAEAYGLLGDLARSQGDQAGAKAAYEKAIATSPSYFPALLGLADTEWDLGERDAAQRHYIAIVGLGRAAPERVKERALGGSSTPSAASTATSSTPASATTTESTGAPATTGAPAPPSAAGTDGTEGTSAKP